MNKTRRDLFKLGAAGAASLIVPATGLGQVPLRVERQGLPQRCVQSIDWTAFRGNVGWDKDRIEGGFSRNTPTNSPNGEFELVHDFTYYQFQANRGQVITIGDPNSVANPTKKSWIKMRISPDFMALQTWINYVSVGTAEECDLRAGAVESQLIFVRSADCGWELQEQWSKPEGGAVSSKDKEWKWGSWVNPDSFMTNGPFSFPLIPSYGGQILIRFNRLTVCCNQIKWRPFQVQLLNAAGTQHESGLIFGIGDTVFNLC